jgi:hypothetical protein
MQTRKAIRSDRAARRSAPTAAGRFELLGVRDRGVSRLLMTSVPQIRVESLG